MKKILFSLFFTLNVVLLVGQGIIIVDKNGVDIVEDTIFLDEKVDPGNDFQSIENKGFSIIINGSNDSMTIGLRRIEQSVVSGTGDALCWGSTCYGEQRNRPVWEIGDTVRIEAGDTAGGLLGGFVTYHFPHGLIGNSTYKYEFYDRYNQFVLSDLYVQYRTTFQAPELRLLNDNGSNQSGDTINVTVRVDVNDTMQEIELEDFLRVWNYSGTSANISSKRVELSSISGIEEVVCWGDSCSTKISSGSQIDLDLSDAVSFGPLDTSNSTNGLRTTFYPKGKTGTATYRYEFFDTTDPLNRDSVIVIFNFEQPTNVINQTLTQDQLLLYPNPAEDILNIKLLSEGGYENTIIELRDLLGKKVLTRNLSNSGNTSSLNISNLGSGVYFVRILSNNQLLITKKVIIR